MIIKQVKLNYVQQRLVAGEIRFSTVTSTLQDRFPCWKIKLCQKIMQSFLISAKTEALWNQWYLIENVDSGDESSVIL